MPCQRIIFQPFQSIQSIAVNRYTLKLQILLAQLFPRNPLSQLELDDCHVLRTVKNPIRVQLLDEDSDTPITHSDDERKQQRNTDEIKDR